LQYVSERLHRPKLKLENFAKKAQADWLARVGVCEKNRSVTADANLR
jgi:hypothetical protein